MFILLLISYVKHSGYRNTIKHCSNATGIKQNALTDSSPKSLNFNIVSKKFKKDHLEQRVHKANLSFRFRKGNSIMTSTV